MNLADFVEETLSEILSGIRAAQKKEGGGAIGAAGFYNKEQSLIAKGMEGDFTVIEFDVSVLAGSEAEGKGGLRVWSIGIQGGGKRSDQQTANPVCGPCKDTGWRPIIGLLTPQSLRWSPWGENQRQGGVYPTTT